MSEDWPAVRDQLLERTERRLVELRDRWDDTETVEGATMGPRAHEPDEPPDSIAEQRAIADGIASVVVFYTAERRETVLVYNPAGAWEPPGGVIEASQTPEEAALTEAREETGLDVELTGLLYAGVAHHQYADGRSVPLPLATFVGHRVGGSLSVEREGTAHPGVARAVGLFDRGTMPELRRDRERILSLLNDPPEWPSEPGTTDGS